MTDPPSSTSASVPSLLSRRRFLAVAPAFLAGPTFAARASAQSDPCTVRTQAGLLRGECLPSARVFRGVPFAAPPTGPLRFRPPPPAPPWSGTRDATRFGTAPLQPAQPSLNQSEDCLYLNLWAPLAKGPFPVFVWIHGGGFTGGHAFEPTFDGTRLAGEGIVCVTVGYRLGVFGFLDLEPALGPTYAGSANNGLRDLIAALAWVQRNVADFGGDPTRVTVGGESAGAKLTDLLMGAPSAQPLFHGMVSESGGAERVWPRATAQTIGEGFARQWRDRSSQPLAAAPGPALIEAQTAFIAAWPQHFPLRPEIDGTLLPRPPIDSIRAGYSRGKRLLIGTNRDESALFIGPHPARDPGPADLGNLRLAAFQPIFDRYATLYPGLPPDRRRIRALTAEEYWIPSLRVAEGHAASQAANQTASETFMYRLDFAESEGRMKDLAYHSLDVGLVWDHPHTGIGNDTEEAALATQIHLAWSAFLRGQAPAAPGLPAWTPYTTSARATMILDRQSRIEQDPQAAERTLWNNAL